MTFFPQFLSVTRKENSVRRETELFLLFCYFSCSSGSSGGYSYTYNSLIYSLRNKEGLGPFESLVTKPSSAIFRHSRYGPTFGGGHDIHIANNANSNQDSYAYFGHSYSVPNGVQNQRTILAGTYNFSPDDWEVFYLP